MPLPIAHGFVGATLVAAVHRKADFQNWKPLAFGFFLANAPDLDVIFSHAIGIAGAHRSWSHSLVFSFGVGSLFLLILGSERWRAALAYGLAYLSHGLLDFTNTQIGGGVRLLLPFSSDYYKLNLISFSEFPFGFTAQNVAKWLLFEMVIFIPLFLIVLLLKRRIGSR
ncbi:MAG: metal-dependent hydrolase [Acidobacteriota bacterium]|nr:metal-dependent hydrolase [Acidobacteriota bacterium]